MTDPIRDAAQALLPCPFCGSIPLLEDCRTIWVVRCSCEACVLGERAPEPDGSEPAGHWDRIRQTAINAWNRRAALSAPQPAADERVAKLMRAVMQYGSHCRGDGIELAQGGDSVTSSAKCARSLASVQASARALLAAGLEDAEHAAMYRWFRLNREARAADGTMPNVYDEDGTVLYGDELDAAIRAAMKGTL